MARSRETWTEHRSIAGCYLCSGTRPLWTGSTAQGLAARHHDQTQHTTWAHVRIDVCYGSIEDRADVLISEATQAGR
jgi:tellurite resistance-related uncharacterized protein